ncbi:hypothetical protein Tco_1096865 [Tanacetum coccineum]
MSNKHQELASPEQTASGQTETGKESSNLLMADSLLKTIHSNDPPLSRGYTLRSGEDSLKLMELMEFPLLINVEALQTKYPIIGWEVHSEDTMQFWKITRVGNYTEVELKMLFEPNTENLLELQKYMHDPLKWWLYDMCAVHHVSTEKGQDIFMLVEKDYPLTKGLATLMLSNKLRVDQQSEMADELLTKIYNIANRPRK